MYFLVSNFYFFFIKILDSKYESAIRFYTKALKLTENSKDKVRAIYYGNRAFCNLKLENYGLAIVDSE